jgi:hypothetical protein
LVVPVGSAAFTNEELVPAETISVFKLASCWVPRPATPSGGDEKGKGKGEGGGGGVDGGEGRGGDVGFSKGGVGKGKGGGMMAGFSKVGGDGGKSFDDP